MDLVTKLWTEKKNTMKLFKCYIVGLNVKCGWPPNLVTKIKVTEEFEDCWSKKKNNNNNKYEINIFSQ